MVKVRKQGCNTRLAQPYLVASQCDTIWITIMGTGTGTGFCWVGNLIPVPVAKPM